MVPSYLTGESTMKSKQRTIERLEPRQLMASNWQNASLIRDVDNSSLVTPLVALLIINNLNSNGTRELTPRVPRADAMFYDVNADNYLTPLDVLIFMNAINCLGNSQPTVVGGLAPASDPNNNGFVRQQRHHRRSNVGQFLGDGE